MLKLPVVLLCRANAPLAVFLATSGVVEECLKTTRRVEVAGGIASEHTITDGRIGFAGSVELEFKLSPEDPCTTQSCWKSR